MLTALGVCVVIGVLINFFLLQSRTPSDLAGPVVAQRLAQSIQFNHHLASPPSVTCPGNEPGRRGVTFRCTWHRGGADVPVTVVVTDRHGDFTYHAPAGG